MLKYCNVVDKIIIYVNLFLNYITTNRSKLNYYYLLKINTIKEIFELYVKRRKFYMFPVLILLITLIGVTTLAQSGLVAFIYPI